MRKLLLTTYAVMLASSAFSATITWNGSVDSDWHTGANWDGGVKPSSVDRAYIYSNNSAVVFAGTESILELYMGGEAGTQDLTINSGTLNILGGNKTNTVIGAVDGAICTVTQNGGAVVITNGCELSLCGSTSPNIRANSTSTWNMVGGTLDALEIFNGERTDVGEGYSLIHQTGGDITASSFRVGGAAGKGEHLYIIDDGTITSSGDIRIGQVYTAHMTQNGGTVTTLGNADMSVGYSKPANLSTLTMTGGELDIADRIIMSRSDASGTFTLSGGVVDCSTFVLNNSDNQAGISTINISGGSVNISNDMIDDNATSIVNIAGSSLTNFTVVGNIDLDEGDNTFNFTLDSGGVTPIDCNDLFLIGGNNKFNVDYASVIDDGTNSTTLFSYVTFDSSFASSNITATYDSGALTLGMLGVLESGEYATTQLTSNEIRMYANTSREGSGAVVLSDGLIVIIGERVLTERLHVDYWTPAEITVEAWYNAADDSTITVSAGAVSEWADQSGNNRDLIQQIGSAQLIAGSDTINGLNVLVGVDKTQYMTNVTPFTVKYIIGVVQQKNISTNDNLLVLGSASNRNNGEFFIFGSNDVVSFDGGGSEQGKYRLNAGTQSASAENHTVTGSTDVRMLDGLFDNTIQMNQLGSLSVAAFGMSDTDLLAEVIQLSAEPDTETRQKIEGYLAWKWGIESELPIGHPYKEERP